LEVYCFWLSTWGYGSPKYCRSSLQFCIFVCNAFSSEFMFLFVVVLGKNLWRQRIIWLNLWWNCKCNIWNQSSYWKIARTAKAWRVCKCWFGICEFELVCAPFNLRSYARNSVMPILFWTLSFLYFCDMMFCHES